MSLQIPRLRKAVELEKARTDHVNQENAGFFQMLLFQFRRNPKVGQGGVEGHLLPKCFSALALSPASRFYSMALPPAKSMLP